jgi:crossover junction endodeoxyribonuclease RusA
VIFSRCRDRRSTLLAAGSRIDSGHRDLAEQETLYPLEFFVAGTPVSLQGAARSKLRWKVTVSEAARQRARDTNELGFLDGRPVGLIIYYFPAAPMIGDIDNIVKPIMDALIHVAYMNDKDVERVVVQKFEPQVAWEFAGPGHQLAAALDAVPPVVYIRVDDDLSSRMS